MTQGQFNTYCNYIEVNDHHASFNGTTFVYIGDFWFGDMFRLEWDSDTQEPVYSTKEGIHPYEECSRGFPAAIEAFEILFRNSWLEEMGMEILIES